MKYVPVLNRGIIAQASNEAACWISWHEKAPHTSFFFYIGGAHTEECQTNLHVNIMLNSPPKKKDVPSMYRVSKIYAETMQRGTISIYSMAYWNLKVWWWQVQCGGSALHLCSAYRCDQPQGVMCLINIVTAMPLETSLVVVATSRSYLPLNMLVWQAFFRRGLAFLHDYDGGGTQFTR